MNTNTAPSKNRKAYNKPQLERVRLVVNEAVLVTCKAVLQTDPGSTGCVNLPTICRDIPGTS